MPKRTNQPGDVVDDRLADGHHERRHVREDAGRQLGDAEGHAGGDQTGERRFPGAGLALALVNLAASRRVSTTAYESAALAAASSGRGGRRGHGRQNLHWRALRPPSLVRWSTGRRSPPSATAAGTLVLPARRSLRRPVVQPLGPAGGAHAGSRPAAAPRTDPEPTTPPEGHVARPAQGAPRRRPRRWPRRSTASSTWPRRYATPAPASPCCTAGSRPSASQDGRTGPSRSSEFRRLTRDLYIAAHDVGFWQGAIREPDDQHRLGRAAAPSPD